MNMVSRIFTALASLTLWTGCSAEPVSMPPAQSGGAGGAGGSAGTDAGGGAGNAGTSGGSAGTGTGGASSGGSGGDGGDGGSAGGGASGGATFGIRPAGAQIQHARDAYAAFRDDFFVDCGGGKTRVASAVGSEETFSEGMGYGMLMVAYLEPDATGPALLRQMLDFVSSKLDDQGLMHWKVGCDAVWGENAATDGDLDYALALIQAEKRWPGNGFGSAARVFLDAILASETDDCGLKPGDVWGGCNAEANPSYAALGYLDVFRCFTQNAAWESVRANTMQRQLAYWSAHYALPPDWVLVDTGSESGRFSRGNYGYDATRVPWRLGVDYVWHGKADTQAQLQKLIGRIVQVNPNPAAIGDGYDYQTGSQISNNHNGAFVAPFTVGAMVDGAHQAWLDAAYTELVSLGRHNYYSDALRVLALMALTGAFEKPCS
jgi:endo-1,4-beta-D-glucanase Y